MQKDFLTITPDSGGGGAKASDRKTIPKQG